MRSSKIRTRWNPKREIGASSKGKGARKTENGARKARVRAAAPGTRSRRLALAPKPGGQVGSIYPLRARRRPWRVRGSSVSSLYVSCSCLYSSDQTPVSSGLSGKSPTRSLFFSTLFSHRFFEGFLKVLASILDDFFYDFHMFFG